MFRFGWDIVLPGAPGNGYKGRFLSHQEKRERDGFFCITG
jgi:hypothetical protein